MSLLSMSLSGSMLITVLIVLRRLLLRHAVKRTVSNLWLLAALRLLIPLALPARTSIYTLMADWTRQPVLLKTEILPILTSAPLSGLSPSAPTGHLFPWLTAFYLAGVVVCAGWFLLIHIRWKRVCAATLPADIALSNFCPFQLFRRVRVVYCDRISYPFTTGILRPVIVLPKTVDPLDHETLRFILAHEAIHIRRWDTLQKYFFLCALILHWFNPFVWLMYFFAARDMELACDEEVLFCLDIREKRAYATTLLQMQAKNSPWFYVASNFSYQSMEERIRYLMKITPCSRLKRCLSVLLVLIMSMLFITTAYMNEAPMLPLRSEEIAETSEVYYSASDDEYDVAGLMLTKLLERQCVAPDQILSSEEVSAFRSQLSLDLDETIASLLSGDDDRQIRVLLMFQSQGFVPAVARILESSVHNAYGEMAAAFYLGYAAYLKEKALIDDQLYQDMLAYTLLWDMRE